MEENTMDLIRISKGNRGAVSILGACAKRDDISLILAYLEGTETFGPKIWILFKDKCGQDLEKFVKQCLPKYSIGSSIETKNGKKGHVDNVSWSKENKCWMYEYNYGLNGSEGYIKESDVFSSKKII